MINNLNILLWIHKRYVIMLLYRSNYVSFVILKAEIFKKIIFIKNKLKIYMHIFLILIMSFLKQQVIKF